MEFDYGKAIAVADAVINIIQRHRDSGSAEPLTNEQVHRALLSDLLNGQSAIAKEFAVKGWPLPK